MEDRKNRLVWIDLEMTGLDIVSDTIMEIATLITTNQLDIIAQGPTITIGHSKEQLDKMSEWCLKTHKASGLYDLALISKVTCQEAQEATLAFLKQHIEPNEAPLCGNSIWQDRMFLNKYMNQIDLFLNYRIIDVSSVKELIRRWYPNNEKNRFIKPENHRAYEDIFYSIEELKHYKQYFFCK